jgi:zinc protease
VKRAVLGALLLAAASCAPAPEPVVPPSTPDPQRAAPSAEADFRAEPPAPDPPVVFVPPRIEEAKLQNGLRILVVERRGLPVVAVNLAVDAGADQGPSGVGSFVGAMLMRGTKTRSAIALSDGLSALGADLDVESDFDSAQLYGKCLSDKLGQLLQIVADVAQNPAFSREELERERSRRLTTIGQRRDRPQTLLSETVAEVLYPSGHPYASPLIGTEALVKRISARDLEAFHRARFSPSRATLAFAGDIDKERAVAEATRAFGAWKARGTAPSVDRASAARAGAPKVVLVDRPGAPQSSVSVALVGVARRSPDFDAIVLMNALLGGQFSSRLNMNLREGHAYAYHAESSFDFRQGAGPFEAGGEILREKTGAAVGEILREIARMRTELVGDEELADAKAHMIQQLPARFETVSGTADRLAALAVYGLPLDEFATRPARWAKVTREDVRRVAERYLPAAGLHLVVVGDAEVVKPQLERLALGEVVVRAAPAPRDKQAASAKAPGSR